MEALSYLFFVAFVAWFGTYLHRQEKRHHAWVISLPAHEAQLLSNRDYLVWAKAHLPPPSPAFHAGPHETRTKPA